MLQLIAVLFGLWTAWSTLVLPRLPVRTGMEQTLQSIGIRLLLWVLPCAVYLVTRYGKGAVDGMRLGLPPSSRHWMMAFMIIVAASLAVSLDVARRLAVPPTEVWRQFWPSLTLEFPTPEFFEELVFRGVVLSELLRLWRGDASASRLSRRQRAWLANVLASIVFVGLHWPWWIFTGGMDAEFWRKSAGVFLISLVLGMVFVRAESLWPCVLLHWVNNALSGLAG